MSQTHNHETADPNLWRARWSHQDGGDQNNLASGFGACKQWVVRSRFFVLDQCPPYTASAHELLEVRTKVIKLVGPNLERISETDQWEGGGPYIK